MQQQNDGQTHTVSNNFWDSVQILTRKSSVIADQNEQLRIQNAEYVNEITRLRTINAELLHKVKSLDQNDNTNPDADRNAELEEIMVKQRREMLWMKRELESQSAELSSLRQECKELRRENGRQSRLIQRQERENSKSMGRVQALRQMLIQQPVPPPPTEPTLAQNESHQSNQSNQSLSANSLEMSITSIAEDVLLDHAGADSPESDTGSTANGKREHPVGDSIDDNISEHSAQHISSKRRGKGGKSLKSGTDKERSLQKQVNELLALTKELALQKEKLKEERDRWVKFVNIQLDKMRQINEELTQRGQEMEEEEVDLNYISQQLSTQLSNASATLDDEFSKNKELETRISQYQKKVNHLRKLNGTLKSRNVKFEDELSAMKTKYERIEEQLAQQKSSNVELQIENQLLVQALQEVHGAGGTISGSRSPPNSGGGFPASEPSAESLQSQEFPGIRRTYTIDAKATSIYTPIMSSMTAGQQNRGRSRTNHFVDGHVRDGSPTLHGIYSHDEEPTMAAIRESESIDPSENPFPNEPPRLYGNVPTIDLGGNAPRSAVTSFESRRQSIVGRYSIAGDHGVVLLPLEQDEETMEIDEVRIEYEGKLKEMREENESLRHQNGELSTFKEHKDTLMSEREALKQEIGRLIEDRQDMMQKHQVAMENTILKDKQLTDMGARCKEMERELEELQLELQDVERMNDDDRKNTCYEGWLW